jgi:hypothetical protein
MLLADIATEPSACCEAEPGRWTQENDFERVE